MGAEMAESVEAAMQKNKEENGKDWKGWLGETTFYIYGAVYMIVRVAVNVIMTVQPFYLS